MNAILQSFKHKRENDPKYIAFLTKESYKKIEKDENYSTLHDWTGYWSDDKQTFYFYIMGTKKDKVFTL